MKLIIRTLILIFALCWGSSLTATEVEIIDGTQNLNLRNKIERNTEALFDEINRAYENDRPLRLQGLMSSGGQTSLEMLWENVHFSTEDSYIGENLINTPDGYQIRNIAIRLTPQDAGMQDEQYKEAVVSYDRGGNITSVYFALEQHMVSSILAKGIQLNDLSERMQILEYVEHFRTAYNERDLTFLNQVFSDDALIITGKVISAARRGDGRISMPQIKYTSQNKQQYLAKLKRVFQVNRYLNVDFSDVKVKRHGSNKNIYGVTVRQRWNSSNYSDDGYVFMVWDFSDPDMPQIHVRTWQPAYLDKNNTQPLPEDEIFDLNSIEGI